MSREPRRIEYRPCVLWLLAIIGVRVHASTATVQLTDTATTSAGIFNSTGHLVRTLWSGQPRPAGLIRIEWDGRDDDGEVVSREGKYRVRLIAHRVHYRWEGVIGNTSREFTGMHIFRALGPINDMAIDRRGRAFYVVGYNELQSAIHRFDVSDPRAQTDLVRDDYRRVFRYVATDGARVYCANIGLAAPHGSPMRDPTSFVVALNADDGTQHHFAVGRSPHGLYWESVIDEESEDAEANGIFRGSATGLGVQRSGNALFIAHGPRDEVRVFDKNTGVSMGTIPVGNPTGLAVGPDDSLWVLSEAEGLPSVVHYRERGGIWSAQSRFAMGLRQPIAIAISPVTGTLVVADAASEQLKAFDGSGQPQWTYGQPGGYRDGDPQVTPDRLWLSAGPTYIAFQGDGSLWIGDPGNARNLHLSAQREYLEQIMYMPKSYHVAVDPADPTRVFNRYLEFAVDYSKPLASSWRLSRNWGAGLPSYYFGDLDGLRSVFTLKNGRTYAVAPRADLKQAEIVELTDHGLRSTGTRLDLGVKLYADGSLRGFAGWPAGFNVYERPLKGFDSMGNPLWSAPEVIARTGTIKAHDPYYHDVPVVSGVNEATFPETSSGVVVLFNPGKTEGFHLGGIQVGEVGWRWRASPAGFWKVDHQGNVDSPDGTFELGRNVQYAGSVVVSVGREVVYGYHGEAWNGGEANQWIHYLDDGLFVGQFGKTVDPSIEKREALAGAAGNAFSPQLVSVGGHLYLWHNDESIHAGVHRWRIDGADQIKSLEAAIEP